MYNVLIINEDSATTEEIRSILDQIDTFCIYEAKNKEDALKICKANDLNLVFIEYLSENTERTECIQNLKKCHKNSIVVVISNRNDKESKDALLNIGIDDYISTPIVSSLLEKRVANYLTLLKARRNEKFDPDAKNLFTKEVFYRSIILRTMDDDSLAHMRDYILNDYPYTVNEILDCLDIIYSFCQFLILSRNRSRVILEENKESLFLTVEGIEAIPKSVIGHVIGRYDSQRIYKVGENKISFKLRKIPKPEESCHEPVKDKTEDEQRQDEVLRKHFDVKISAQEYVSSTPFDIMTSIENLEEIEDKIDIDIVKYDKEGNIKNLHNMAVHLNTYFLVIENLVEFDHLAFAVEKLSKFLASITEEELGEGRGEKLILLLDTVLQDITQWRNKIFIEQNTEDIHYMDSSLLNSFLQIEMIFDEPKEDDDDILELF